MRHLIIGILLYIAHNATAQSQYDFSPIENKIKSWVDSGYYPGASIIIAKDNKVIYEKYFGNYKPETVAYIASAGKWLAAAAIAAVVDQGKLHWDDKVKKWLPEFTDIKGEATLRQLLSHTAGYPDYQPAGKHPDNYQTLKEAVANIISLPADTLPGTKFRYGGLAMQVAGRMAELATGKDWETIFQSTIARPLHMRYTHFTPVDETPGHNPMIGGGTRAALHDYANFLSMILNNGVFEGKQILSAKAIAAMQADQIGSAMVNAGEYVQNARASNRSAIYGLGEWREEVNAAGEPVLISSPSWAGAYPWIDKKNKVYGFFLTRVNVEKANANGFSSFYGSPVLPLLVRDILQNATEPAVKRGWIHVGDAKLYYEELGKGEPLILVHGHSLDHTMWNEQFYEFAKTHRVIRYDLRGYGRSSMPSEDKQFLHAEDLNTLMQKLGIQKAHLVGLSLGGFVVTDMLALHADKILTATLASGNIFPVPGPDHPMDEAEKQKRYAEIAALKKKGIDVMKREWFNALMRSGGSQKERMRYALWKMIYEWDAWQPLHLEPRLVLGLSVNEKLSHMTSPLQGGPRRAVPVLILEGKSTTNKVPEHPEILDLLPGSKLVWIEDAGHMCNMEQPEAFNREVLRFVGLK